jgi:guanylate kinase
VRCLNIPQNKRHYHFVKDVEGMKTWIRDGAFLEHAEVHGNYYGTSWSSLRDVQKGGKRCLLDIDVQGVQNIKTMESSEGFRPKYIFIAPPSMESLKTRLIGRGTESEETLARRTANAQRELDYGLEPGNFDAIVVNRDLDLACEDFARRIEMLFD